MKRFVYPELSDYNIPALLTESYGIISNKQFSQKNLQILANTAHGFEGIVFDFTFGHPDNFGDNSPGKSEELVESLEFKKLEREVDHYLSIQKRFGGEGEIVAEGNEAEAVDPMTILLIIESIAKLIQILRNRKKK